MEFQRLYFTRLRRLWDVASFGLTSSLGDLLATIGWRLIRDTW
jgi:hypothetical protein